jgi:hypothetical protein
MKQDEDQTTRRPLISRETVVPVGVVAAVICIATASAWQLSAAMTQGDANSARRFEKLETGFEELKAAIERGTANRLSRSEHVLWIELLRARNPALDVPTLDK